MEFTEQQREIEAIKRLKYRYMRGIDEKRWDQIEACFVPDATCAYSGGKYAFSGRDAIMKFLTESMARPTFLSSHRITQPEIDLTSDTTATGIWALEDYVIDEQYGLTIHGAAFYRDQYAMRGMSQTHRLCLLFRATCARRRPIERSTKRDSGECPSRADRMRIMRAVMRSSEIGLDRGRNFAREVRGS